MKYKYKITHFIRETEIVELIEISEDTIVEFFETSFLFYINEYDYQGSTCIRL
jgi:hypothetical protein